MKLREKMEALSAIGHRIRRALWVVAVIGLGVCSLGLAVMTIVNVIVKRATENRIIATEAMDEAALERLQALDADCILVLGAGVREGGKPSLMLSDRLSTSIALYESDVCDRLLMSGDHGRVEYDEVNVMKDIAVKAGVPSEHVFMDHAGFSTYDSLYRAKHIFQAEKVIIVTQRYHLFRSIYIARAMKLDAVGVSASLRDYSKPMEDQARESLARVKDFIAVILRPESADIKNM